MNGSMLKIFSGSSNIPLAEKIAEYAGLELGKIDLKKFSDGELSVKITENVRGSDIFLIQSTSFPANDHIIELLLIMDAFRRASARRITIVTPYFGYARQDRKVEPRVPISAKVVAKILETIGTNRLLAMDLHADQIQGFFDIPVDHLFAAPVLIDYFKGQNTENTVIVSPDSGGAERARFFAKHLNCGLAIIDKRREKANEAEVMNIIGNVSGKNCIMVDDMIDTAGTIAKGARALMDFGAAEVRAVSTHGVLSGPACERLEEAPIKEIIFTDTINIPENKRLKKINVLSVAPLIGEAILRIHDERSVSNLFV
ncbi:MAG: ribose-phosphate pyrophosphokinase [Spirochaetia bacterium]|nr:ribose-phosphate pyrophosphokinase [Spirochaetia bacterium]